MKKSLIVGIDLSFNSTGITFSNFLGTSLKTIEFHRLVFDSEKNKIKRYVPKPINNVNQTVYRLPANIIASDIIIDKDYNSLIQTEDTLKSMICIKKIMDIIDKKINKIDDTLDLYINIEGFLMPQIQGEQQFKSLSGLIMLQGLLRSDIIKLYLSKKYNIDILKIFITTPKELKLFFSGNGNADKQIMLEAFYNFWDGKKLINDINSLKSINDVIDSFALMVNAYGKINGITQVREKKIKTKKIRKKKLPFVDILKTSIIK